MRIRPLLGEITLQELQCQALGVEMFNPDEDDCIDGEDFAFGADPFDILAFKQEQGDH